MQKYRVAALLPALLSGSLLLSTTAAAQDKTATAGTTLPPVAPERNITLAAPQSEKIDYSAAKTSSPVTLYLPGSWMAEVGRTDIRNIRLKSERVTLQTTDSIPKLLEASGISPDVNAFALIYDLNPDIDDIRSIPPGTPLILPRVEGDLFLQKATSQGYRISLVRDLAGVLTIISRERELEKIAEKLSGLPDSRFSRAEDKAAVIKALETARLSLRVIGSNRYAVSQRVLKQSALEAERLMTKISKAINSGGPLSFEFRAEIESTGQALQVKSVSLEIGGSAQARIEVQTIRNVNGKAEPVPLLRIFYAPVLNPTDISKYRAPSTPTTEALPVGGSFTFWAANNDDGSGRVSDTSTITVRSKNNDPIQLLVVK